MWVITAAAVAISALDSVNHDAKLAVALASVLFPLCAVAAALSPRHRAERLAGFVLLVSVASPTYFAYALNVPALIVALRSLLRHR